MLRRLLAACAGALALVAQAAYATTVTVCLVANPGVARNWTVPSDWSNTGAYAWALAGGADGGPGASGTGAGGGGAGQLADSNNAPPNFTPGETISVQVGKGGGGFAAGGAGASWICLSSTPCTSNSGAWVGVDGAGNGTTTPAQNNYGSSGGSYATGDLPHVSGHGGNGDTNGGGGGGGVQSLSASGGIGGNSSTNGGGDGGSAAGASPASGGTGATSTSPVGAAGNSSPTALATCTGGELPAGTQVFLGSGGGGGSPNNPAGGDATSYGGGGGGGYGTGSGGHGYQGMLIIQYTQAAVTPPPPAGKANPQMLLMGVGLVSNDNAPPAANDDAPIITRRAAP